MTGREEVTRLKTRLDRTFDRIDAIGVDELELRSDFARYLCVLVSGYLEQAVTELLLDHSRAQAGPNVQRYVSSRLERFQNATKGNLVDILRSFNPAWGEDLDAFVVDDKAGALGTVVKQRHRIAHGQTSDISFAQVKQHYERVEDIVQRVASLTHPI